MAMPNFNTGTPATPGKPYKAPRGTQAVVSIDVDSLPVERLLHAVEWATSGTSLRFFLENDAHEWFREEIFRRFMSDGDRKSGDWAPLKDATIDIRRALGFGDDPINRRTDEMFEFVTTNYDIASGGNWAELNLPGDPPDPVTAQKLETAQRGSNRNPLGYGPTQPRPVLAVDQTDMAQLMLMLEVHIMYEVISGVGSISGSPGGGPGGARP